jgi:uncharacterized protein
VLKQLIFWGSWIYFPFALLCLGLIMRGPAHRRWLAGAALAITSVLAYARFVEPRRLVTHRETVILPGATLASPSIRIALFADTHVGVFGNAMPMRRIVARINRERVDAVFLAGDITYHVTDKQLKREMAALGALDAPLFAVLGNHDIGFPGPDLSNPLLAEFARLNTVVPHNRAALATLGGRDVIVAGASDLWQRQQDFGFAGNLAAAKPVFLLTHNPDTALHVPDDFDYDLMLAGHTHGGQIRIPGLVRRVIPTQWAFDKELHVFPTQTGGERLVYVTSGTGMVGLPFRFNMPPRVDILTIHLPE